MMRAIFFDFDGVLTTDASGGRTMSENFCRRNPGISMEHVLEYYRQFSVGVHVGEVDDSVPWTRICAAFGLAMDAELLSSVLRTVPKNDAMCDLAQALRQHYRVGIITDNGRARMRLVDEDLGLSDVFDPIVVSAIVGATKRERTTSIYDTALARAGCSAGDALFIDNKQENLEIPMTMGMKTYWHDDAKNDIGALVRALQKMGVECEA